MGLCREVTDLGGDDMVRNDIGHPVEPEDRDLVEDLAFLGDAFVHDHVEGGKPIGGHEQQVLTQVVDVTDFAAVNHLQCRHIGFENDRTHDYFSLLIRSWTRGAIVIVAVLRSSASRASIASVSLRANSEL